MGSTTFLLPNALPASALALLRQACFAGGYDQTPIPTQVQISGDRLLAGKHTNESGYLLLPWPVEPFGTLVTTTATLREQPEPYRLLVELARGKLNQVRTQAAEWQDIGLQTPPEFDRALAEVIRLFAKAVLNQEPASAPEADAAAVQVLERCYELADRLARLYAEQMFGTRVADEGKLPTRLAARFLRAPVGEPADDYRRTFNAAQVGLRWRDLEPTESHYEWDTLDEAIAAARDAGLPITAGPVIDLTPGMLPDWAIGWRGDLPTLAAFMCDFLETVIGRYKAHVRRWIVCAGVNHADGLGLTDDDRLRLTARLFEAAAQLDPELDLILSVAQPWGDYLVNDDQTISPLAFADDLVRAGTRVNAVELELRNGVLPRGGLPRDLLDTSRLLDLFGMLGLPLEVVLSRPASDQPDAMAVEHGQSIWQPGWNGPPTPDGQAAWGTSLAALALCKPQVRAVTWDHWSDADPHLTPRGGIIAADGSINPLLAGLRSLRTTYLA